MLPWEPERGVLGFSDLARRLLLKAAAKSANGDARCCCPDACDQRCVWRTSWLPARWMGIFKRKGWHHSPCCEATIWIVYSTCTGMLEVFSLWTYLYQYIYMENAAIFLLMKGWMYGSMRGQQTRRRGLLFWLSKITEAAKREAQFWTNPCTV